MQWTGDLTLAAWIEPRRGLFGFRDGIVPMGFEAVVRIFHPTTRTYWHGPVNRSGSSRLRTERVSWGEVAAVRGTTVHPWMSWGGVAGRAYPGVDLGDGTEADPPPEGGLPHDLLASILPVLTEATSTPAEVVVAVWDGWSYPTERRPLVRVDQINEIHDGVDPAIDVALQQGPLLALENRDYLLLTGRLDELQDPAWTLRCGLGDAWGPRSTTTPPSSPAPAPSPTPSSPIPAWRSSNSTTTPTSPST